MATLRLLHYTALLAQSLQFPVVVSLYLPESHDSRHFPLDRVQPVVQIEQKNPLAATSVPTVVQEVHPVGH